MTTANRAAAAVLVLCAAVAVAEDAAKGRETFTAFAVSLGGPTRPSGSGYDLRYAHQVALPGGGRRILLGTERPMSARELIAGARSIDYPFTVVEMRLDARGEGQGKLSIATRVVGEGDTVELENYDMAPVQLTKIRAKRE